MIVFRGFDGPWYSDPWDIAMLSTTRKEDEFDKRASIVTRNYNVIIYR